MSLEEVIESNRRRGFADSYIDLEKGEYGFWESTPEKSDFTFHVKYGAGLDGGPVLMAEGHRDLRY